MFKFFKNLFSRKESTKLNYGQVVFNSEEVIYKRSNGDIESIKWENIDAFLIETTDQGPMLCDVFFLLLQKDMNSGCIIPQEAIGCDVLFKELQFRFKSFNYELFSKAMRSTENNRFLIWEKLTL